MKRQRCSHRHILFLFSILLFSLLALSLAFFSIGCEALKQAQQKRAERLKQKSIQRTSMAGEQQSPLIGQPAPNFTGRDLKGNTVTLSDFKGGVVLVNFWATWCPPCRGEIPHLDALYKKYKGQGIVVIGVNSETDHAKVKQVAEEQISYIVLLNGRAQFQEYGVKGIPCTYYIDKAGIIRYHDVGYRAGGEKDIEWKIVELLQ